MNNIILLLLLVLIFTFTLKPIECMTVNLKCKKYNNNYYCKEKDTFSSITNNLNNIFIGYKEEAQKKYNIFKKQHDKDKKELEKQFGKIKT